MGGMETELPKNALPHWELAGKIYNTLMSQVVAGKKFGGLNEVESVRFIINNNRLLVNKLVCYRCNV